MSFYSLTRSALFAMACLAVACAPENQRLTGRLAVVPAEEVSQLPGDCGSLADISDEDLGWARAEGDPDAIVLDTPDGSCVARCDVILRTLSELHRDQLSAQIALDFGGAGADPSPHPDVSADPSPHPDKPQSTTSADPSPHPDKNDGDGDDAVTLVVVVVIGGGTTGGDSAPAPSPMPTNKPD